MRVDISKEDVLPKSSYAALHAENSSEILIEEEKEAEVVLGQHVGGDFLPEHPHPRQLLLASYRTQATYKDVRKATTHTNTYKGTRSSPRLASPSSLPVLGGGGSCIRTRNPPQSSPHFSKTPRLRRKK